MAENDMEKTEAPTARRLEEARSEGNVAKSTDLTAACTLLVAIILIYLFGQKLFTGLARTAQLLIGPERGGNPTRPDDIPNIFALTSPLVLEALVPLFIGIMAAAVAVTVAQVGFLITGKPLELNITKLSPLRGIKNMFDARAGIRLVMSLAKIAVIASVASIVVYHDMPKVLILSELQVIPAFGHAGILIFSLALKLAALLIILALMDYAFQKYQRTKDLRMSKHDVKEEMKRMEGDPLVKQRRTRVARQLAMQRVAQDVPTADVIVTNPTHYSIALKYNSKTMAAPRVVAKGADYMALRIRQIAIANDIPIVERKPLAQALFRTVEPGQEIPAQFFTVVAEILAYVYKLSGKKTA